MANGIASWKFADRVVVVTGASTRRGIHQVRAFATAGAKVFACDRDVDVLDGVASNAGPGGSVEVVAVDTTKEANVAALAEHISEAAKRLDILVINDYP